jgi:hypothetical protein
VPFPHVIHHDAASRVLRRLIRTASRRDGGELSASIRAARVLRVVASRAEIGT